MIKPSLHCDEELYNIKFCTNLGHGSSQPPQHVHWLICRQSFADRVITF